MQAEVNRISRSCVRHLDPRRVAVGGHSFEGQLTLLLAEHDPNVGAIVVFGPGGGKLGRLATVAGAVTRRCRRRERARVFHTTTPTTSRVRRERSWPQT